MNLSTFRKAIAAGLGAGGSVFGALAAVGGLAPWIPLAAGAAAGLGIGLLTYFIPNAVAS